MEPVISVIIPVYNVEPYLRKCIDSVCGQTLREIEIILVDDGSRDNGGKICDEYAAKDNRIRVIHQENRGLSAARNTGIDAARTDIVGFVDSDDWIEPDMFALLYRNLVRENADISVCGFNVHKKGKITVKGDLTYTICSGHDAVRNVFQRGMVAWNKLYRKHLFNSIRFPEGHIYEDICIMVRLTDAAKTVVFDMQPKYHYMRRKGSITTHHYRIETHDLIDFSFNNYSYVCGKYPDLADLAWCRWINAYFAVLMLMLDFHGVVDREKEEELVGFLKDNRKVIWSSPNIGPKKKLFLLALCVSKPLCKCITRIWKQKFAL